MGILAPKSNGSLPKLWKNPKEKTWRSSWLGCRLVENEQLAPAMVILGDQHQQSTPLKKLRETHPGDMCFFSGKIANKTMNSGSNSDNHMDVSENSGTPKSSILLGFSIINHPVWGTTIFGNTYMPKPPCRSCCFRDPGPATIWESHEGLWESHKKQTTEQEVVLFNTCCL